MNNRGTRLSFATLALWWTAWVLVLAGQLPVSADTTTYSSTKREFKVGILLIESTIVPGQEARGPENPDPYVFHIADQRSDVKPQGWEFVNPLAPGVVTADVRDRWAARDPRPDARYQLGQKITKDMAAYWEVDLTRSSIQELVQFDLLFIHNHRPTGFSPADREKLRKLVDAGGIVWIENCGGMFIQGTRPFFLDELQLRSAGGSGQPFIYEANHPLLNSPYQLSIDEIRNLGDKNFGGYVISSIDPANPNNPNGINRAPNTEVLVTIIGSTAATDTATGRYMPYVAAGQYGSGRVLATAGDTGCDINDYCGGVNAGSGGNSGAFSGTRYETAHIEDLKFLYNIVAWGSSATTERNNNRRTATSFDSVGAPVVTNFNFDNAFTRNVRPADVVNSASSPLIVNKTAFVSGVIGGNVTVRAYDTQPFADADGDGNFDDGLPDISLGLPYDEIWRWQGGSAGGLQPSSPVYARVPLAGGGVATPTHTDRIYVALPDGTLVIFPAFAKNAGGSLLPTPGSPITVPGGGGTYQTPTGVAPAPVIFENRIYQVMPNGLVRCVSAINGTVLFTSFDTAPNYTMRPLGTPTLGFVRQASQAAAPDNANRRSGTFSQNSEDSTNDLMMYVPCLVTDANGTVSGRIFAYWLGTRNEVQRTFAPGQDGQNGIMVTRVGGGQGGPGRGWYYTAIGNLSRPLGAFAPPRVRVFSALRDTSGNILATAQEQYRNGILSADYTVDFTNAPSGILVDGRVPIIKTNSAAPDPRPGIDILIAVDYDVIYIPTGGTAPPEYGRNPTQVGARPSPLLNVPFIVNTGLDNLLAAPSITTDDLVTFGLTQQWSSGNASGPVFSSVQAVNEQEGDTSGSTSRLRWKYSVFNDFSATLAPTDLFFTRTVDDLTVTDIAPIVNYLRFDANWPQTDLAQRQGLPEALRFVRIIGSPIVTNQGITYVLAQALSTYNSGPVTVLMAFNSNPQVTLVLPEPFDDSLGVTVSQANLLSDPNNPQALQAPASKNPGAAIVMDGDQGRITINNARAGNNAFSLSQSFVVRYTPRSSRQERRVIVTPVPLAAGDPGNLPVDSTGQLSLNTGGYTPLLYYYVLPGQPGRNASPTLIGDYIYWTGNINVPGVGNIPHLYAVDARPQDNDASVRVGFGEQVIKVTAQLTPVGGGTPADNQVNHVRMAQRISSGPLGDNILPPVAGAEGNLLVNTALGTYAYRQGVTLIADSKRLVEAGGDGGALWAMDATIQRIVGGGEEPVFGPDPGNPNNIIVLNPPATGVAQTTRQTLARPTVARRIASSDYLFADTGNNRVVRTDRSGEVKWELSRFSDPYGILESGEPLTLNSPTDVQFYINPTLNAGGAVVGYEVHYLVADGGNFRIIEVADYFNTDGEAVVPPGAPVGTQPGEHVVVWSTRTSAEGKRYRYQSIQRFLGLAPAGTPQAGFTGYPFLTAIVSNTSVGTGTGETRADFTGGSIVRLRYAPFNTTLAFRNGNNAVPAKLWEGLPARANEPVGNGTVSLTVERARIVQGGNVTEKRINAPNFFQQLNLPALNGVNRTLFLVCDAEGAYVIESRVTAGGLENNILWMFTQSDYDRINGVVGGAVAPGRLNFPGLTVGAALTTQLYNQVPKFQPASIQLLPSGNYLITNSYSGRSSLFESGQFTGEVFEVSPAGFSVLIDTPFGNTQRGGTFANFAVPRIQRGATGIGLNEQVMGNPTSNTGLVEQPTSAFRP